MKPGQVHFTKLLPPELLARLDALIDGGQKSAREIFVELGLVKHVAERTLRTYVTRRRRERAARADSEPGKAELCSTGDSSSASESPASSDALLAASIDKAYSAVLAGQVKASTLASLMIAVSALKGSKVREEADRRAGEKHEVWKAEKSRQLKSSVDEKTQNGAKSLTRDDVYDLVDKVMRGET